ncbi:MAG: hypothetical protein AAGG07_00525 [Planctomycetota bacterium]
MSAATTVLIAIGVNLFIWGGLVLAYVYFRRVKKMDLAPGWWVVCKKCHHAHRFGDIGGVRFAPPWRRMTDTWVPCPKCAARTPHYKLHEYHFDLCPFEPDFGDSGDRPGPRQRPASAPPA